MLSWVDSHSVTLNLKQGGPIQRYISFRLLIVSNYASWGEFLEKKIYVFRKLTLQSPICYHFVLFQRGGSLGIQFTD